MPSALESQLLGITNSMRTVFWLACCALLFCVKILPGAGTD